jgi:fimbrial chaperone protein
MVSQVRRLGVAAAFAMLLSASGASAATFTVNPTQIFLSGRTTTALLTLRNDSEETLRFQLTAFGWQQTPSGEITLTPTQDVVFFPALLTLAPKEERRIRVGSTVPAAAQERTYRIFVEELPQSDGAKANAVRVLTKMGIPIFIRPAKEVATADLRDLALRAGSLSFSLANRGSVHFVPQRVVVRAVGASGERLAEQELKAWYILAGGRREFEVVTPAEQCARVASLSVEVAFDANVLEERLQTPGGTCAK